MGTKGREALAAIAPETAAYFVEQCSSSNYAVRESACHCMGELATKVDPEKVAPQVGGMLRALLGALGDVNWPVREAACGGKTSTTQLQQLKHCCMGLCPSFNSDRRPACTTYRALN